MMRKHFCGVSHWSARRAKMDKKLVKPLLLKKVITVNKLLQMHLIVLGKISIGSTLAIWYVIHNVNKGMYMYGKQTILWGFPKVHREGDAADRKHIKFNYSTWKCYKCY